MRTLIPPQPGLLEQLGAILRIQRGAFDILSPAQGKEFRREIAEPGFPGSIPLSIASRRISSIALHMISAPFDSVFGTTSLLHDQRSRFSISQKCAVTGGITGGIEKSLFPGSTLICCSLQILLRGAQSDGFAYRIPVLTGNCAHPIGLSMLLYETLEGSVGSPV